MAISLSLIIYAAVKPMFKIYAIIGLGFLLARKNILTVPTCRDISRAVVTAIMPCLIFNNIVTNLKSSDIKNLGIIFFEATLLFTFGALLSYFVMISTKSPKRWVGGILSVGLFPNISDLPIAYLQSFSKGDAVFTTAEGDKGVAYVCIFLAAQVLYQFSLGLYKLIEWDFRDELKADEESTSSKLEKQITSNRDISRRETASNHEDSFSSALQRKDSASGNSDTILRTNTDQDIQSSIISDLDSSVSEPADPPMSAIASRAETARSQALQLQNNYDSLALVPSRSNTIKRQRTEDIGDVISMYSQFQNLREITTAQTSQKDTVVAKLPFKERFSAKAREVFKNFCTPNSLSLIISIAISMSPPLKALFVKSSFYMPNAPDEQPPLSFFMDIASYVGAASVPLGLLLLGATISRLSIKSMPKGFWKTGLWLTISRLVILPIIGVGLNYGLDNAGWWGGDKILRFVCMLQFGLPSATALVYFTAFYTNPESKEHLQMDCLAVSLIFQYVFLSVSLPFLVSFTLKVPLGY